MECPRCRLTNPNSAIRCDCGYDFQTQAVAPPPLLSGDEMAFVLQTTPLPRMWAGFGLCALMLIAEFLPSADGASALANGNLAFQLLALASWIYWLWCVHRYHEILTSIPGHHHAISPGQAVVRHFIPIYNLYWVFEWPSQIATFVNWRTQSKSMRGWIVGLLVLGGMLFRLVDGSVGMAMVFAGGVYLSRSIRRALASGPVAAGACAAGPVLGIW